MLLILLLPLPGSAEPRQQVSATSPDVLMSVGRLLVPGRRMEDGYQRHYRESCSATLLTPESGEPASLVLTAWHCLEYHTDLTDDITFVIETNTGERLRRRVRPVSSGGGMDADWWLMRLQEPLPADTVRTARLAGGISPAPGSRIIMAGFSRDRGLGQAGKVLTFHRDCRVVERSDDDIATDCLAYRGASGGAVFSVDSGRLVGVISRGDSGKNSIFVPVSRILGRMRGLPLTR
ncbi:MAG: serine protease [Chromatocurvus sp.]